MPGGGVKITGLNKVTRELLALGVDLDDLKDAFAAVAKLGADKAASFAPVRSGKLRASIRPNRAKNKAVVTAGRASIKYAGPINYGWRRRGIEPAGFMQKADHAIRDEAVSLITKGIDQAINKEHLS